MSHFDLEPFPCEPDGHEGFPNSYRVYDTFRGKVFVGDLIFRTKLQVWSSTSVYASAEEIEASNGRSVDCTERREGDVYYKDTDMYTEAKKLYRIHMRHLKRRETVARMFDYWWPTSVSFFTILGGVWAAIEIAKILQNYFQ